MPDGSVVRVATLSEIISLRAEALIAGTDRSSAAFDGDNDEETRHFGAFSDGVNVACASCMASDRGGAHGLQLRGMATQSAYRSRGLGAKLLAFIETDYGARSAELWCNARTSAIAFYERNGWECVSEEFDIAGVGPHREMKKRASVR